MRRILLHLDSYDKNYLPLLQPLVTGKAAFSITYETIIALGQLDRIAKKVGATVICTTSLAVLRMLVPEDKKASIDDYSGSLFKRGEFEVLILNPLEQLATMRAAKFIAARYFDKVLHPERWLSIPEFKWELFEPGRLKEYEALLATASFVAVDIETYRDDPDRAIECISFTGVMIDGRANNISLRTFVIPFDNVFNVSAVRRLCRTSVPKAFQRGKYDLSYLMRYGIPVTNYLLDTLNLFHCWLCELPKDLGFVSAFLIRDYIYHKNEGSTGGSYARFSYNAKDTYYTALSVVSLLVELPAYAWHNYSLEFPVAFPCFLAEQTGIRWDTIRAEKSKKEFEDAMERELKSLQTLVACQDFNPSSPQQTVRLFALLGSKDVTSSESKSLQKVASRHPLNRKILGRITKYREARKLVSSYFKEKVSWLGRVYFSLSPEGTDTGRLASKESSYWCGIQIQNVPDEVKDCFIPDDGFWFGEADYSQAETRDAGYLSGDENLILSVEREDRDFHAGNASDFLGVPYERVIKSWKDDEGKWHHKVLDKPLRQTGKKVNHGATYNMGDQVLVDTMGEESILWVRDVIGLPKSYSLLQVAHYLLKKWSDKFPTVKGPYYDKIISDVKSTGFLVGPTGWTRKCFGQPWKSKPDLNAYVAHPSQSLNAMMLNEAFISVFLNVWLLNQADFKLIAQVHDSILFQYRKGRDDLPHAVAACMSIPIPVTDCSGKTRTLIVPVDVKGRGKSWADCEALEE